MARVFGENALIYFGAHSPTNRVPLVNDWEVNIEQEKIESPQVMFCPDISGDAGLDWVERSGGQYSANGSVSALYDDTNHTAITQVLGDAAVLITIYPDCEDLTSYWIGNGWLQLSHRGEAESYIGIDYDFESTGKWQFVT